METSDLRILNFRKITSQSMQTCKKKRKQNENKIITNSF